MKRMIFTGGYLLSYANQKRQFGVISASSYLGEYIPSIKVLLGKQIVQRLSIEEDSVTFDLSIEECSKLAETLKKAEEAIQLLITLSKRGKLADDFYFDDSEDINAV